MTKEEFIAQYAARSGMTVPDLKEYMGDRQVVLPCDCDGGCEGWAMVSNTPESLKAHADLYAPSKLDIA